MPDTALDDAVQTAIDNAAARIAETLGGRGNTETADQIGAQIATTIAAAVRSATDGAARGARDATSAELAELRSEIAALEQLVAAPPPAVEVRNVGDLLKIDPHAHNPDALGAALDGQFETFGSYLRTAIAATLKGRHDDRIRLIDESGDIKSTLTGEEIELGGALVPEEFRAQLMGLMLQPSSIRSLATVVPMGSSTLTLPYIRDESHADGSVFGGVKMHWIEAGTEIPEEDPRFGQARLTAKGLLGRTNLNNTMIQDSAVTLPALIAKMFRAATMWEEERTFLRGTGAGEPLGILNAPATIAAARSSDGSTDNGVKAEDVATLEERLLPECDPYAVYHIHPGIRGDLIGMSDSGIRYWQQDMSKRAPMTLQGRPVFVNEHCSAPGTPGDIILADWRFYLIADRQAMSFAASEHQRFSSYQTILRCVSRLDGQPWLSTPLTPAQGTDTLSPFVTLAA